MATKSDFENVGILTPWRLFYWIYWKQYFGYFFFPVCIFRKERWIPRRIRKRIVFASWMQFKELAESLQSCQNLWNPHQPWEGVEGLGKGWWTWKGPPHLAIPPVTNLKAGREGRRLQWYLASRIFHPRSGNRWDRRHRAAAARPGGWKTRSFLRYCLTILLVCFCKEIIKDTDFF